MTNELNRSVLSPARRQEVCLWVCFRVDSLLTLGKDLPARVLPRHSILHRLLSVRDISQLFDYLPQSRLSLPLLLPGLREEAKHVSPNRHLPRAFPPGQGAQCTGGQGSFQFCERHELNCESSTCGLGENRACNSAMTKWGGGGVIVHIPLGNSCSLS